MPFETGLFFKDLGANITLEGLHVTDTMKLRQMPFQINSLGTNFRTKITLKRLNVTKGVNSPQVSLQTAFLCKLDAANLALVSGAISAMNSSKMSIQLVLGCKLPAANLALVSGVRMLWSWHSGVAVSMRCVVVSVDG